MATHPASPGRSDAKRFKTLDGDGRLTSRPEGSIFPIVTQDQCGTFVPIGTGFFIAEQGVFLTAAHVVQEVLDAQENPTGPLGIFHFTDSGKYLIRRILNVTRHNVFDVAVGIVEAMTKNEDGTPLQNSLVILAKTPPLPRTRIHTFAFPKTQVIPGAPQEVKFAPGFYEGEVLEYFPHGRDGTILPGPCYSTSIVSHGGASGGPVFNAEGSVFAINSTGIDGQDLSFASCVSSALDLFLDNIHLKGDPAPRRVTIRELCERGFVPTR